MKEYSEREHFQNTDKFFLSTFDFDKTEELVKHVGTGSFLNYLDKKVDLKRATPLNVAVVGPDGCGKESHIKAWLELKLDKEIPCTYMQQGRNCVGYSIQKFNIVMWKLTPVIFLDPQYLKDVGFSSFDFFLILGCNDFLEIHSWLANKIILQGKQFFYIHTKVDEMLHNQERFYPKAFNEVTVLRKLRNDIIWSLKHTLSNFQNEICIFVVNNNCPEEWDFPLLLRYFLKNCSEIKQSSMQLSPLLDFFVLGKKINLKRNLKWLPFISALASFVLPVPLVSCLVDELLVKKCIADGKEFYGLNSKFLKDSAIDLPTLNRINCHWAMVTIQVFQIMRIFVFLTMKNNVGIFHLVMACIPGVVSFWHLQKLVTQKVDGLSSKLDTSCSEWIRRKINKVFLVSDLS